MCIIILAILDSEYENCYKNTHIQFDSKDVNSLTSTWLTNLSWAEYMILYNLQLECTDSV
jgi:hypothetical protein